MTLLGNIQSKLQNEAQNIGKSLDQNYETNYTMFGIAIAIGIFFFLLSFLFLPIILISPKKFCILFCLGSLCIVGSFFFVKKPSSYISSLFSKQNSFITICYLGSIVLTIFATIIWDSYLIALPATIVQFFSAMWMMCRFFPGGMTGMSLFWGCVKATAKSLLCNK